jgi:hypothetical protein
MPSCSRLVLVTCGSKPRKAQAVSCSHTHTHTHSLSLSLSLSRRYRTKLSHAWETNISIFDYQSLLSIQRRHETDDSQPLYTTSSQQCDGVWYRLHCSCQTPNMCGFTVSASLHHLQPACTPSPRMTLLIRRPPCEHTNSDTRSVPNGPLLRPTTRAPDVLGTP